MTTRRNGLRSGQPSGQRNTTISTEMKAMQWRPGQSGNTGGRPKLKPISDELRRLLDEPYSGSEKRFQGMTNVRALAERMWEMAMAGDLRAMQEITDRVEGKVAQRQELCGPDGGAIPWASYTNREENERRILELEAIARGPDRAN
jgi:Family of unknown function (DUF5681)